LWHLPTLELTPNTLCGVGIDYPKPNTIGPDRLANAVAANESLIGKGYGSFRPQGRI
jgi:pantothenate kinase type III